MAKRPIKPRSSTPKIDETADFSAADVARHAADGDLPDDFDLLEDFDPDSDASCWDPGEIDLDEPEYDESDFCLEDETDDDG